MAAQLFFMPFRPAFDSSTRSIPGAQLWFTLSGTNTEAAVYEDADLTTPRANPVIANGIGRFPTTYLDGTVEYRVRAYAADATVGVSIPLEEYDPYESAGVLGSEPLPVAISSRAELAALGTSEQTALLTEEGFEGIFIFDAGDLSVELAADDNHINYIAPTGEDGSGGAWVRMTDALFQEVDYGTLPAGTTIRMQSRMQFEGNASGDTDARNYVYSSLSGGAADIAEVHTLDLQMELRGTGTTAIAKALTGYVRNGIEGVGGGDVDEIRVCEMHPSNESDGTVGEASTFYAAAFDFADGEGDVNYTRGFHCRDQCDVDRLIGEAVGFDCANFTASTRVSKPLVASFRSQMGFGTGRWAFYGQGGAAMCNAGLVRFGDTNEPANQLEVKGYAKLTEDGSYVATLGYHEIGSNNNNDTLLVWNAHATDPFGIHIKFTTAPNDRTQYFLRCEDSVGTRSILWADGGATFEGKLELPGLVNAANDGAAAAAGVGVNQVYRNGSVLMIRVA